MSILQASSKLARILLVSSAVPVALASGTKACLSKLFPLNRQAVFREELSFVAPARGAFTVLVGRHPVYRFLPSPLLRHYCLHKVTNSELWKTYSGEHRRSAGQCSNELGEQRRSVSR